MDACSGMNRQYWRKTITFMLSSKSAKAGDPDHPKSDFT